MIAYFQFGCEPTSPGEPLWRSEDNRGRQTDQFQWHLKNAVPKSIPQRGVQVRTKFYFDILPDVLVRRSLKCSFDEGPPPFLGWIFLPKTSKTTFNNDQPRSGKEKDLWLETLWKKVNNLKAVFMGMFIGYFLFLALSYSEFETENRAALLFKYTQM